MMPPSSIKYEEIRLLLILIYTVQVTRNQNLENVTLSTYSYKNFRIHCLKALDITAVPLDMDDLFTPRINRYITDTGTAFCICLIFLYIWGGG